MILPANSNRRRGAILPLAAVLMVFFLALVAFSVDVGWIVLAQSDLQSAADSAALAGTEVLMENYVLYNLPTQSAGQKAALLSAAMTSARTKAKTFAGYNSAGSVSSLALNDADIEFGFTDTSGTYTAVPTFTGYPNMCKVVVRLDSQANGSLSLFFAPVLGVKQTDLTSTATAALFAGTPESFAGSAGLLPVTFDVEHWDKFLATGQDPDGNTTLDANGNPVLLAYPSIQYKGNFGLLSLDSSHVGASTVRDWVDNGASQADINELISQNLIPLSKHDATKWDWNGENGFKQSVVSAINDYIGKTFTLPLYKAYNAGTAGRSSSGKETNPGYEAGVGQGSDYDYNIVRFVGIRIMPGDKNGVTIQPAAVIEPNMIYASNPTIADTTKNGTNLLTTFSTPKLIR
jgi:Flp pilus assembly protein TadG